jgi:hypothetical protein
MYFQVYCREDSKCYLNVVGERSVQECEDVLKALQAARERSIRKGKTPVTVYSTTGSVIMEAVV